VARAGHTDAVRALAVANERLFSGSYDGTVKVWDVDTLACLRTLAGHTGPVRTLVYSGGHMFSGSYDKTVRRPPRPRRRRTAPPRACLCGGSRHDPAGRMWLHAVRRGACRGARARRIGGRPRARQRRARAGARVECGEPGVPGDAAGPQRRRARAGGVPGPRLLRQRRHDHQGARACQAGRPHAAAALHACIQARAALGARLPPGARGRGCGRAWWAGGGSGWGGGRASGTARRAARLRARRQVWDSHTLQCLRTLEGHEDNVRVLAVGDRFLYSGSWDKSIRCAPGAGLGLGSGAGSSSPTWARPRRAAPRGRPPALPRPEGAEHA